MADACSRYIRQNVVKAYANDGMPAAEVASRYKVSIRSVYRWWQQEREREFSARPRCRICGDTVDPHDPVWGRGSSRDVHATCELFEQGRAVVHDALEQDVTQFTNTTDEQYSHSRVG